MTDEELMLQYRDGDEPAFQLLYERNSSRVFAYISKRLDQKNWVEDVFQLVFTKLHQSRHQFNPRYSFDQWIFVITKTVLLDFWKTIGLKNQRFFSQSLEDVSERDLAAATSSSNTEQIKDSMTSDLLNNLTQDQREIVTLRFLDELSYSEIANRLSLSEVNVRQMVSRAVQKLKKR